MKEEKGVDLKIKISNELLKWFLNESDAFYLLTDQSGKILSFSENISTYFSLNDDYEVFNNLISKYIGDENWQLLSVKINSNFESMENYLVLPHHINDAYTLGSKWKSFTEEDNNRIFLIFRNILKKSQNNEDKDVLEFPDIESDSVLDYYKECLDLMELPAAILKNNDFIYKNTQFDHFIHTENINNCGLLINWINNYSTGKNGKIESLNNNLITEVSKGNICYKLFLKCLLSDNKIKLIYLLKSEIEKEGEIIKTGELIENDETIQKNKFNDIKDQLNNLRIEFQDEYNKISNSLNFDLKTVFNKVNNNYTEYEKIITFTSENLLNMSESFTFIEDISVKIHLISINAAIESAKSGEQGKGFAVIAKEIAKLSSDIKEYTKKIGKQIKNINEYTKKITIKEETKNFKSIDEFKDIPLLLDSIKSKLSDATQKITLKINNILIK